MKSTLFLLLLLSNSAAADPDDELLMIAASGIAHAEDVGRAYRSRYVSTGFLDGRYLPSEATLQASDVHRTLMSAGHWPLQFTLHFRANLLQSVHAPILTIPYDDDPLLAVNFKCTNGWSDIMQLCNIAEPEDMPSKLLECLRATNWNCSSPHAEQSDTLISEFSNPLTKVSLSNTQSICALGPARTFMMNYLQLLSGSGPGYKNSLIRLQRTARNLTNRIVANFKEHDINQVGLMNVFSSHNRSALFFDMFVIDGAGESFREFKYCDQLPPDFERINGFCTLESLERAKSMSITDDPIECASEQPTCCPEGGTWSEWATEGDCTTTCGSCSERTRTRTCTSAAYDCPCKGESSEVGPCGISLCPFPATQNCCSPYAKKKNEKTDTFFCGSENEPPYEPC